MFGKNFAGATDNLVGQSGEFGDFDTVAFVGRPAFDFAQEDDAAAGLFHGDVKVLDAGETIGELGQLVVVSGEERLGASRAWMYSSAAQAIDRPS